MGASHPDTAGVPYAMREVLSPGEERRLSDGSGKVCGSFAKWPIPPWQVRRNRPCSNDGRGKDICMEDVGKVREGYRDWVPHPSRLRRTGYGYGRVSKYSPAAIASWTVVVEVPQIVVLFDRRV